MIDSPQAWDSYTAPNGVVLAFVDSGIDQDHPDLEDNIISGYNSVNRVAQVNGGNVNDVNGHGHTCCRECGGNRKQWRRSGGCRDGT